MKMLNSIKKIFNTASAELQEVEMVEKPNEQAPTLAVPNTAETSALVAQLASQSETLESVQKQLAEMSTQLSTANAALAAVEAAKAALIASAHDTKMSARKQRVELVAGTDKAPALLAATETLDDVQFEAIVSAMAVSFEAESKSTMFTEVGVSAEAEVVEVDAVKRLADKISAQFKI